MKYFLKSPLEKEHVEVTKEQYIIAEKDAGFTRDDDETISLFSDGKGTKGKVKYEDGEEEEWEKEWR